MNTLMPHVMTALNGVICQPSPYTSIHHGQSPNDRSTYQQAGVNLESSRDVKRRIRGIVTPTHARKCWPASEYSARCIRLPMTKTPYWSSASTRWGTELKLAVMTGRPGWHRRGSGERLRQRRGRMRCEAHPVSGLHQHERPVTRRGDLTRQVYAKACTDGRLCPYRRQERRDAR